MARNPARTPVVPSTGRRTSPLGFFGDIISELRKVTWPTREEATRLAALVLAISLSMGALLGLVDMAFSKFLSILAGN